MDINVIRRENFRYQLKLLKKKGITQEKLANELGSSKSSFSQVIGKNPSRNLGDSLARRIESYLGLSRAWLDVPHQYVHYGVGDVDEQSSFWNTVTMSGADDNSPLTSDEVEVPFFDDVELSCGHGSLEYSNNPPKKMRFSKAMLRKVGALQNNVVCCVTHGDSMSPLIPDGTTVAIDCGNKTIIDGKIYAFDQGGWKRIKYIYRTTPTQVTIRSVNKELYSEEQLNLDEIEIIGRIFWWSVLDY